MKDLWEVDIKRYRGEVGEVSVLKSSFTHGKKSYGWFGENKIVIAGSGGPCNYSYPEPLGEMLIEVANRYCEMLNKNLQN